MKEGGISIFAHQDEPVFKITSLNPSYPTMNMDHELSEYLVILMSKYIEDRNKNNYEEMDKCIEILALLREFTSWQISYRNEGVIY